MNIKPHRRAFLLLVALLPAGCGLIDDMTPKKPEGYGLIATPPTYYSTAKARYLATKYRDNLDRLVERIAANPKTGSLQFANNISSVGGIGFFTHSATKAPDERFLELVLGTPETFDIKGEFSDKVQRLFARYGVELLSIVSADNEIYQDREMSGYGLNLAWRNLVSDPAGKRAGLERAIIYFPKERVRSHLRQGGNPSELLADAVIFAVEEDGPLTLVSYRPKDPRPDVRPAIQEDNLASAATRPVSGESSTMGAQKSAPTSPPVDLALIPKVETRPPVELPTVPAKLAEGGQPIEVKAPPGAVKPAATPSPETAQAPAPAPPLPQDAETVSVGPVAALKNRPIEMADDKPATLRPATKPLEGFIIQLAFTDREKAQQWADRLAKRGFVVSLTEAGAEGSLRVRLGNFAARDEAERQLRTFKQEGMNGIVVNLPQAFRPIARTSMP